MVRVVLVPTNKRDRRGKAIMADLRERLARVTGPLTLEVRELSFKPPAGWPVAVRLSGESFKQLKRVSERVQEQIRQIKGVTAVSDDLQLGRRELRLRLDPHRASRYGLSHDQLAAFVRAAHGGLEVSRFRHRDEELDVVVRFRNAENRDLSGLATLNVNVPYASAPVPLSDLVRFDRGRGFAEINHRDQKRTVTITADLIEGKQTADGANREVRRRIANLVAANPEIDFAYGGEWEETERSVKSLFNAFAIAALLIFTILAAQFRSFAQPLVVILAIPLSLIGVVIGFFVSGEPVGLIALVGVVGLAGIAVNDATVLVDFINARRREGIEPVPARLGGLPAAHATGDADLDHHHRRAVSARHGLGRLVRRAQADGAGDRLGHDRLYALDLGGRAVSLHQRRQDRALAGPRLATTSGQSALRNEIAAAAPPCHRGAAETASWRSAWPSIVPRVAAASGEKPAPGEHVRAYRPRCAPRPRRGRSSGLFCNNPPIA
jgi:hypothetical protein